MVPVGALHLRLLLRQRESLAGDLVDVLPQRRRHHRALLSTSRVGLLHREDVQLALEPFELLGTREELRLRLREPELHRVISLRTHLRSVLVQPLDLRGSVGRLKPIVSVDQSVEPLKPLHALAGEAVERSGDHRGSALTLALVVPVPVRIDGVRCCVTRGLRGGHTRGGPVLGALHRVQLRLRRERTEHVRLLALVDLDLRGLVGDRPLLVRLSCDAPLRFPLRADRLFLRLPLRRDGRRVGLGRGEPTAT